MGECVIYVYYESRKRELKIRLMNEGGSVGAKGMDLTFVYYEWI